MSLKVRIAAWFVRRKIVRALGLKGKERKMFSSMLRNWQPTIAATGAGAAIATGMGWRNPDGSINWVAVIVWLLTTLFGAVAKQHDATGGTVPLTEEAKKRAQGPGAEPATPGK